MLSARAAAEKDPVSTTRTKACIAANRSMLIPPRNGVYLPDAPAASIGQRSTSTGRARPSAAREVTEGQHTPQSQARRFQGGFRGRQRAARRRRDVLGLSPADSSDQFFSLGNRVRRSVIVLDRTRGRSKSEREPQCRNFKEKWPSSLAAAAGWVSQPPSASSRKALSSTSSVAVRQS